MARTPRDEAQLRHELGRAVLKSRLDAVVFAAGTLVFTPLVIGGLVFLVLLALGGRGRGRRSAALAQVFWTWRSFLAGLNIFLIIAFILFFASAPKHRGRRLALRDLAWVALATAGLGALLWLSYGTTLLEAQPALFWTTHAAGALGILACLGRAYEQPLSAGVAWSDDASTAVPTDRRVGQEVADVLAGLTLGLPYVVLGSWASIFGSSWVVRGLNPGELAAAASLIRALGQGDAPRAQAVLRSRTAASAVHVVRALTKLGLVAAQGDRVVLTSDGEKFAGVSEWF